MSDTPEVNTRDRILEKAREQFACEGYAATSMRRLAEEVGVRPSSLYHHFESKRAILDALTGEANAVKEQLSASFENALTRSESVERGGFVRAGIAFLHGYLQNEKVRPLLRILDAQRDQDAEAEKLYHDLLYQAPLASHERVFESLRRRGLLSVGDARLLAAEYQAILLFGMECGDETLFSTMLGAFYDRTFVREENV